MACANTGVYIYMYRYLCVYASTLFYRYICPAICIWTHVAMEVRMARSREQIHKEYLERYARYMLVYEVYIRIRQRFLGSKARLC